MANLKRTRNKLLRSGYLPNCQVNEKLLKTRVAETWIDITSSGTPISFYIREGDIDSSFKVHGPRPDQPEFDDYNNIRTKSISEAINLSRAGLPEGK